jgi:hypothetical protein
MSRAAMFSVQEMDRIVFSVLRGECTVAETVRDWRLRFGSRA